MRFFKRYKWTIALLAFILLVFLPLGVAWWWLIASYLDRGATTWFFAGYITCLIFVGLSRAAVAKQ